MRAVLLLVLLAGCVGLFRTEHAVYLSNHSGGPVTISVNARDIERGEDVFSHTFQAVADGDMPRVEHDFRVGADHLFTAWNPTAGRNATGTHAFHSGSWALTVNVGMNGELSMSMLHGD